MKKMKQSTVWLLLFGVLWCLCSCVLFLGFNPLTLIWFYSGSVNTGNTIISGQIVGIQNKNAYILYFERNDFVERAFSAEKSNEKNDHNSFDSIKSRNSLDISLRMDGFQEVPITGYIDATKNTWDSSGTTCVVTGRRKNVYGPCKPENLAPRTLPYETSVIETDSLPIQLNLMPEVSNGHVATVVQQNSVFMNGLYSGANVSSSRARIPSTAAVLLSDVSPGQNITQKFRLDMGRGVFSEVYTGDGFSFEFRRYAHRQLTRLLVTEVVVNRTTSTLPITLSFSVNSGRPSTDIDFTQEEQGLWTGQTKVAEYPSLRGRLPVAVAYTLVPPELTFAPSTQGRLAFFTSVSHDKTEALEYLAQGQKQFKAGTLFSSHASLWDRLWAEGSIGLKGNDSMALETTAALYYLYSALPLTPDTTWPFVGMSPGGLAHGNDHRDYMGHVFWDQDTWMFPPLALLNAGLGRQIVGTRLRTLPAARLYAKQSGLKGARYPWESAVTGLNTSPSKNTTKYELHVTGDTGVMIRQYLQLTNDTDFLTKAGGYEMIRDIADFWVSRSVFNSTKNKFEILGVMGPDEYHGNVNNSAFTNAGAVLSLRTAQLAARLAGRAPDPIWGKVADNMVTDYDQKHDYHPEFDTYKRGVEVKQADTILLGFPLHWKMNESTLRNDLTYYATVTPGGPAMTWGLFAINWLRLGQLDRARENFYQGTWNIQEPFKVWSENADGGGAYNFHTGMGGYLQSLLYGYAGADLGDNSLNLHPRLPPSITAVALRGLDYRGGSLDLVYDANNMTLTLTRQGAPLQVTYSQSGKTETLQVGKSVHASCQLVTISPVAQ